MRKKEGRKRRKKKRRRGTERTFHRTSPFSTLASLSLSRRSHVSLFLVALVYLSIAALISLSRRSHVSLISLSSLFLSSLVISSRVMYSPRRSRAPLKRSICPRARQRKVFLLFFVLLQLDGKKTKKCCRVGHRVLLSTALFVPLDLFAPLHSFFAPSPPRIRQSKRAG